MRLFEFSGRELEELIERADEGGAFDECWEAHFGGCPGRRVSEEAYVEDCQRVAVALFGEGWLSRFRVRRAVRRVLARDPLGAWKERAMWDRISGRFRANYSSK